jgi:hypothetical protein
VQPTALRARLNHGLLDWEGFVARAIRGINPAYFAIASLIQDDVERLNKEGLRIYLENRIRYVQDRIDLLVLKQGQEETASGQDFFWEDETVDAQYWEDFFELDYLEATRDALMETLAMLGGINEA